MRRRGEGPGPAPGALLPLFPLLLLLAGSASVWGEDVFSPPEASDDVFGFASDGTKAEVRLKENREGVELARLTYAGGTKPDISLLGGRVVLAVGLKETAGQDWRWSLVVTESADYERERDKVVKVAIPGSGQNSFLAISIVNLNDNPPVLRGNASCRVEVGERYTGPTDCAITVTDADGGAQSMHMSVDDSEHFAVEYKKGSANEDTEATYLLRVVQELNYEKFRLHSLNITAEDTGLVGGVQLEEGPQFGSFGLVVNVIDTPDEPPVWETMVPSVSVAEKAEWEVTLKAVDGDFGLNWTMEYSLEFPDTEADYKDCFSLDKDTGKLSGKPVDRDTALKEVFRMRAVATEVPPAGFEPPDFEPLHVTGDIVVIVADINDHVPSLGPAESGGGGGEVRGAQKPPQNAECAVYSKDVNGVVEETSFSFPFSVTDPDLAENGTFSLKLEKSDWSSTFMLVPSAGYQKAEIALTALNHSRLDFEDPKWRRFTLKVIATEQADPSHVCTGDLRISLKDINDEPPELVLPLEPLEPVPEHSELGHSINNASNPNAAITAKDPDGDADLRLRIDWSASTATKGGVPVVNKTLFTGVVGSRLDPLEGGEWAVQLLVADRKRFDWEEFDQLTLQLVVEDIKTDPDFSQNRERRAMLQVTLQDENDNPPQFTVQSLLASLSVAENTVGGIVIGALVATDADGPGNNNITYSITPLAPQGLPAGLIVIDPETGQLRTGDDIDVNNGPNIDFEEFRSHGYTVTASDGENRTPLNITVRVIDVNDNVPYVERHTDLKPSIVEKAEREEPVTCVSGLDDDTEEPYRNISYLLNPENYPTGDYFKLDRWTGCITLVDHALMVWDQNQNGFEINVHMRDNFQNDVLAGSNVNTTTRVRVTLLDVNDNSPQFEERQGPLVVREGAKEGDAVGSALAVTDLDEGHNGTVACLPEPLSVDVLRPTDRPRPPARLLQLFRLADAAVGCALQVANPLEGFWGDYRVTVQARDNGTEPRLGQGTYTVAVQGENMHPPAVTFPEESHKIYLQSGQEVGGGRLVQYEGDELEDFQVTDEDDPDTDSGKVTVQVVGGEPAKEQFDIRRLGEGEGYRLTLRAALSAARQREYQVELQAVDGGDLSSRRTFSVMVLEASSQPDFLERNRSLSFAENATGLAQTQQLPEAVDANNELRPPQYREDTFYHLIEADSEGLFSVNASSGEVQLRRQLDYELQTEHWLVVVASHSNKTPSGEDLQQLNPLNVSVQVEDINDNPPVFVLAEFVGAFSQNAKPSDLVTTVLAEDADSLDKDQVTYQRVPGSGRASTDALKHLAKDEAFSVRTVGAAGGNRAEIRLQDNPGSGGLEGFVTFDVLAFDSAGPEDSDHQDKTTVKLFVVSDKHRVTFSFYNSFDDVNAKKIQVEVILSNVLNMTCAVEGVVGKEQADVQTHFLENDQPKLSEEVYNMLKDAQTSAALYADLSRVGLSIRGASRVEEEEPKSGSYVTTVLGASCAVLAVLVIVFSLAFVVRTRTLSRRLDNLTSKRFGSQESGLNRDGLALPGTNQHATEGSNPVWKEEDAAYDNASVSSAGDSDLIGIEDSPEFSAGAGAGGWAAARKVSVNPLAVGLDVAAMAGLGEPDETDAASGPRRLSLNPLALGGGGEPASEL